MQSCVNHTSCWGCSCRSQQGCQESSRGGTGNAGFMRCMILCSHLYQKAIETESIKVKQVWYLAQATIVMSCNVHSFCSCRYWAYVGMISTFLSQAFEIKDLQRDFFTNFQRSTHRLVTPKSAENSGLGILVICPDRDVVDFFNVEVGVLDSRSNIWLIVLSSVFVDHWMMTWPQTLVCSGWWWWWWWWWWGLLLVVAVVVVVVQQ